MDTFETVYLPTAQFLAGRAMAAWSVNASARLLIVAGGAPGSNAEAAAIEGVWPQRRTTVLDGEQATETAARNAGRQYQILHFAAHATADDQDPLGSHLLLAADDDNDGFLHVSEIADENFQAQLIVLSACETLSGRLYNGEGLMGLARAFLAGGSNAVVATRWPVGPAAADLMRAFYKRLAEGEDPAAALRAAQTEMRQNPDTAHPFYWAGFMTVAGNPLSN